MLVDLHQLWWCPIVHFLWEFNGEWELGMARSAEQFAVDKVSDSSEAYARRCNSQVIKIVEPLLTARHPSQLYQAFIEGLLLFIVLAIAWARPRKPGVIFGLCCGYYGIARIVGELFRQPDAHIANQEFALWGITRGQLLSAVMCLAGIVIISICAKRSAQPLGGWRKTTAPQTHK